MTTLRSSAAILVALLLVPATSAVGQETTGNSPRQETTGMAPPNEPNSSYQLQSTIHVTKGFASTYRLDSALAFATLNVGDTKIMDVAPLTDRSVLIEAHETGSTNMIFFDSAKTPIKNVVVVVDAQGSDFVKIHNKAMLNSYTMFACWDKGCQFAGENTVAEPAPLPPGYSSNTFNQSVTGQVAPGQPAPPAAVSVPIGRPGM